MPNHWEEYWDMFSSKGNWDESQCSKSCIDSVCVRSKVGISKSINPRILARQIMELVPLLNGKHKYQYRQLIMKEICGNMYENSSIERDYLDPGRHAWECSKNPLRNERKPANWNTYNWDNK